LDLEIDVQKDDTAYYNAISKKVNKIDPQQRYMDLFIPLGIFIGEKMRRSKSAHWQVEKKYGYRPYFMPILMDGNDNRYLPWYRLDQHLSKKKFDLDTYLTYMNKLGSL
ncbi:hypothetical protein, partial [[Flexibacter] sp. ATCC 35208]|uniref:hypothetical protein n=2 Tax=unclassified Chitinophaga TaxID=2619133 RepID=UPI0009CF7370